MMNKKSQVGKEWIFGIAFLFALTIIYLTFNVVFNGYLGPIFIENLPANDVGQQAEDGIVMWLTIWEYIPYILMGLTFVYLIILSVKKEPVEREF